MPGRPQARGVATCSQAAVAAPLLFNFFLAASYYLSKVRGDPAPGKAAHVNLYRAWVPMCRCTGAASSDTTSIYYQVRSKFRRARVLALHSCQHVQRPKSPRVKPPGIPKRGTFWGVPLTLYALLRTRVYSVDSLVCPAWSYFFGCYGGGSAGIHSATLFPSWSTLLFRACRMPGDGVLLLRKKKTNAVVPKPG